MTVRQQMYDKVVGYGLKVKEYNESKLSFYSLNEKMFTIYYFDNKGNILDSLWIEL